MNKLNLKIFAMAGLLAVSGGAWAIPWEAEISGLDSTAQGLIGEGQQPSNLKFKNMIEARLEYLKGFEPWTPFLECHLATFQVSANDQGYPQLKLVRSESSSGCGTYEAPDSGEGAGGAAPTTTGGTPAEETGPEPFNKGVGFPPGLFY